MTLFCLRKIIKMLVTRCQILRLKCTKFDFGWGSAPDPRLGSLQRSHRPPSWIYGTASRLGEGRERDGEWECKGMGRVGKGGDDGWESKGNFAYFFGPHPYLFCSHARTRQNIAILKKLVHHGRLLYTCANFDELWPTNP